MTAPRNDSAFDIGQVSLASTIVGGSGPDARVTIRYTNGEKKTYSTLTALQESEDFESVLDAVEAGRVLAVDYKVLAFFNGKNANGFRIFEEDIEKAAKDTAGRPLLMDHRVEDSMSEVGVLGESEMTTRGGHTGFKTLVSARDKTFQRDYLRGMRRSYSSHFVPSGKVKCGACGSKGKLHGGRWASLDCGHYRGQEITEGDLKGTVVELLIGASGYRELSSTPNPALRESRAFGPSLSDHGHDNDHAQEMTDMANKAEEKQKDNAVGIPASQFTEVLTSLATVKAEKASLEAEVAKKDATIERLKLAAQKWEERAQNMCIEALQASRRIGNTDEDIEAARVQLSHDFDKGKAFLERRTPMGQFSLDSAGDASANEETLPKGDVGPADTKGQDGAPESPVFKLSNGETAVGLRDALVKLNRGSGWVGPNRRTKKVNGGE